MERTIKITLATIMALLFMAIIIAAIVKIQDKVNEPEEPVTDVTDPEEDPIDEPVEEYVIDNTPPIGEFEEFTLYYNGNGYNASDEAEVRLPTDGQAVFYVRGTESYTVSVITNLDEQTGAVLNSYSYDGINWLFRFDDYTTDFVKSENLQEDHFIIECSPDYYSLDNVLKRIHEATEIQYTYPIEEEYPFKLIITSSAGEVISILLKQ